MCARLSQSLLCAVTAERNSFSHTRAGPPGYTYICTDQHLKYKFHCAVDRMIRPPLRRFNFVLIKGQLRRPSPLCVRVNYRSDLWPFVCVCCRRGSGDPQDGQRHLAHRRAGQERRQVHAAHHLHLQEHRDHLRQRRRDRRGDRRRPQGQGEKNDSTGALWFLLSTEVFKFFCQFSEIIIFIFGCLFAVIFIVAI